MTATVRIVPFSKLTAPEALNARPATKDGLDELAASIVAKGIIQPLAVRPADSEADRFEVIDGRRRFLALQQLAKQKKITRSYDVPVIIRNEADDEALETSLIANTVRLPMHPVDQFTVFARLSEQGVSNPELASRFGVSERVVQQRLALGRLAPVIRDAWKKDKITEREAQAFADAKPEAQEAAWKKISKQSAGSWREHMIRSELTGDRPKAKSISPDLLAAYEAAGGTVTESLFEDERYVDDPAILKAVIRERLEIKAEKIKTDGWAWVAFASDLPRHATFEWPDVRGENCSSDDLDYTDDERKRLGQLDEYGPTTPGRAEALAEQREIERAALLRTYTPEMRARSGVIIDDGHEQGFSPTCDIHYGIVRPAEGGQADIEDSIASGSGRNSGYADDEADEVSDLNDGDDPTDDEGPSISNALLETITTSLTLAAADALPADPRLALKAAIAALSSDGYGPLRVRTDAFTPNGPQAVPVSRKWKNFAQELAALDGLSDVELLNRFARLMSAAVNCKSFNTAADRTNDMAFVAALPAKEYLAAARQRFLAEDYFKRATKDVVLEALDEMAEAGLVPRAQVELLAQGKKADAATVATEKALRCGWLPPELRHPAYALITATTEQAA